MQQNSEGEGWGYPLEIYQIRGGIEQLKKKETTIIFCFPDIYLIQDWGDGGFDWEEMERRYYQKPGI